jgi:tRNA pseudouridine38-40 synthase
MAQPTLNPESGFRRLKIDLSYDGTEFAGWAKQPDQRTIQEEIEEALSRMTRHQVNTVVAGRTDAGVHALHQIIHVDIPAEPHVSRYRPDETEWDIENFYFRINQILSKDIRINSVVEAPANFHARFSAEARHYRYKILDNNRVLSPLQRLDATTWFRELDIDLMNEASAQMIGEKDFATFCRFRPSSTTIRHLQRFEWSRDSDGFIIADLCADAFGWNMVRNLVGAAVCVGEKRYPVSWMKEILTAKSRVSDSYVFPGSGLTLMQVDYPADEDLLARIDMTLARRDETFNEAIE